MNRAHGTAAALALAGVAAVAFPARAQSAPAAPAAAHTDAEPGARAGHAMAFDAARGLTLLLGGDDRVARSREWLRAWDGRAWRVVDTLGPPQRTLPAADFDTRRGVLVVFGGLGSRSSTRYGDLWEWDGRAWTERLVRTPGPRDHHAMAYDAARGRMVMFGGQGDARTAARGTWTWDGETWTLADTLTGPVGLAHHAMAYDARRERVVLYGGIVAPTWPLSGETWEWDGARWERIATSGATPGPRARHRMTWDATRGAVLLHGGNGPTPEGRRGIAWVADTWAWNGIAWRKVADDGASARGVHALAFDARRGRAVLFGGAASGTGATTAGDTWEWDGTRWSRASPPAP